MAPPGAGASARTPQSRSPVAARLSPVHPRTHELLEHLTTQRAVLQEALDATPPGLREQRPAEGRWSIAQVLEHLAIVERQVVALLRRGVQQAMATGPLPDDEATTPVLPTIDGALLLDRERRVAAGPQVQPSGTVDANGAWQALERHRSTLLDLLHGIDGKRTDMVRAPHPVLGTLTLQQWIAFLGFHEARHAAQIRAVMFALGAG